MKSVFQNLAVMAVLLSSSVKAMAVVAAPAPELGEGVAGSVVAAAILLAFVLYPLLKKSRQTK
jgi:hypothetical protein